MTQDRPLEPDDAEFRELLATAGEYVAGVVAGLAAGPAVDLTDVPALVADPALQRPPPETGRPLPELLEVLDRAASKGHINPSGGHMAYIPGSGVVSAAVADLVADVLNRYTGLAAAGPGLVALEATVLRWLADLFNLPEESGGILTTGGSLAAFSALVTARHARLPEDFLAGTIYVSDQAHQSVAKSARLAGFPDRAVRVIPPTRICAWTSGPYAPRSSTTGPRGVSRSAWSPPPGPPTPAPSTRCPSSRSSRPTKVCGCTSTRRTAASSS